MADFGNYPNMGHCVVENTVNSMRQLLDGLSEARTEKDLDLNQYEKRAYDELYDAAQAIINEMERLEHNEENEVEEEDTEADFE